MRKVKYPLKQKINNTSIYYILNHAFNRKLAFKQNKFASQATDTSNVAWDPTFIDIEKPELERRENHELYF